MARGPTNQKPPLLSFAQWVRCPKGGRGRLMHSPCDAALNKLPLSGYAGGACADADAAQPHKRRKGPKPLLFLVFSAPGEHKI